MNGLDKYEKQSCPTGMCGIRYVVTEALRGLLSESLKDGPLDREALVERLADLISSTRPANLMPFYSRVQAAEDAGTIRVVGEVWLDGQRVPVYDLVGR